MAGAPISLLAATGGRHAAAAGSSGGISASAAGGISQASMILAAFGAVNSAIGSYYSALGQRYELRSQASSLDFEGSMADLNARLAERDASALLEAGKHEKALSTLRFGQVKEASRTRMAAGGVELGVGSAAEVQTSIEAAKEIDSLTIERNALRAAGASRMQAVNLRNQAQLARVSAANLRRTAGTISPALSAFTSLIGGAGQVSSAYLSRQGRL